MQSINSPSKLQEAFAALGPGPLYIDEDGDVGGCVAQVLFWGESGIALFFTGYLDRWNANTLGRLSAGPITIDGGGNIHFARGSLVRDRAGQCAEAYAAHRKDVEARGLTAASEHAELIAMHGGKINGEIIA